MHEEDTLEGGDICLVPGTAGFSIEVQNPAPQGEKSPIDQDDHRAGEFAVEAHHGGLR
jgi:hypothetical protein